MGNAERERARAPVAGLLRAAPRTAHIFPLPLLIFLNGFIPIASVLLHNPFRILLNLEYLQTELAFKGR